MFFWSTCIDACGWLPSAGGGRRAWLKFTSVYLALAHLLDRQVEDLGRAAAFFVPSAPCSSSRHAASAASATSSCAGVGSEVDRRCWAVPAPPVHLGADSGQLEVAEAALAACLDSSMAQATRTRLPPEIFDLPVEKMRAGWYTDAYFNHARAALLRDGRHPHVLMQVFQKNRAWLGGMDEAIASIKLCAELDGIGPPRCTTATGSSRGRPFLHDRRRLHRVCAPRDGVPRHARATDADHDECRARVGSGEPQADHLHACSARPPPCADGRRLRGLRRGTGRRRGDRRHDRRAGVVVGRPRYRHRAARADCRVRRRHGARRADCSPSGPIPR